MVLYDVVLKLFLLWGGSMPGAWPLLGAAWALGIGAVPLEDWRGKSGGGGGGGARKGAGSGCRALG